MFLFHDHKKRTTSACKVLYIQHVFLSLRKTLLNLCLFIVLLKCAFENHIVLDHWDLHAQLTNLRFQVSCFPFHGLFLSLLKST